MTLDEEQALIEKLTREILLGLQVLPPFDASSGKQKRRKSRDIVGDAWKHPQKRTNQNDTKRQPSGRDHHR